MQRIHIPNLFLISGDPRQGKTSLSQAMRASIATEYVPADVAYWHWAAEFRPDMQATTALELPKVFPRLSLAERVAFFDWLVQRILVRAKYAYPDIVVEGWVLSELPESAKARLRNVASLLSVVMRRYQAQVLGQGVLLPDGRDYTVVARRLRTSLREGAAKALFASIQTQKFDGFRSSVGVSDCKARLAALRLPSLQGKTVLDFQADYGYFAVRMDEGGATVYAAELNRGPAITASRVANAVYRLPQIRIYHGDWLRADFKQNVLFDVVVAHLDGVDSVVDVARRASMCLRETGTLVLEIKTPTNTRLAYTGVTFTPSTSSTRGYTRIVAHVPKADLAVILQG